MRLNTGVRKNVGAFHILTAETFYLQLTLETAGRDDAGTAIQSIRKGIGLSE